MKELRNYYSGEPIVDLAEELPPLGEYYSNVIDCEYIPLDEVLGCLVFKYKIVHCTTLDTYYFTEVYYCGGCNPKTESLSKYLSDYGIDYELEEQLIGMREKITISLDYLGGMEHPIIGARSLIAKPPRLEEDDIDTELSDEELEF